MVKFGERTVVLPIGDVEGNEKKDPQRLFADFLVKFNDLAAARKIHSFADLKPYDKKRLEKMRSDIEAVRDRVFNLRPVEAQNWKLAIEKGLYGNNKEAHNAVYCVSDSAGRDEWKQILLKVLEILHPVIKLGR